MAYRFHQLLSVIHGCSAQYSIPINRVLTRYYMTSTIRCNWRKQFKEQVRYVYTCNSSYKLPKHKYQSRITTNYFSLNTHVRRLMCTKTDRNNELPLSYADVDTCDSIFNVAYSDLGDRNGPVLLFLHGSPGSFKDFSAILPYLPKKECRIILTNFPGYGYCNIPVNSSFDYTPSVKAKFIKDFLETIQVDRVNVLVSHSLAATTSTYLCTEYDIVDSWVSIAGVGTRPHHLIRPFGLVKCLSWLLHNSQRNKLIYGLLSGLIVKATGFKVADKSYAVNSTHEVATLKFEQLQKNWTRICSKRMPFVLLTAACDKFIEREVYCDLIKFVNIPDEKISVVNGDGKFIKGNIDTIGQMQAVHLEKGKHWLHASYPEITATAILNLLQYVKNI